MIDQNTFTRETGTGESIIPASSLRLPLILIDTLVMMAMLVLLFTVYLDDPQFYAVEIPFVVAGMALLALSITLALLNRIRIGAVIFLGLFFIAANLFGWLADGIDDPTVIIFFAALIPLSGLYLGRRGTITFTIINVAAVFGFYVGGLANFLDQPTHSFDIPLIVSAGLVVVAVVYEFTYAQLNRVSQQLQAGRNELERQNRDLSELGTVLERRIAERTEAADRRARLIEAAAEVGRAATSIYTLDELLPQVARLIGEQFDFYHVGIFLLDEIGQNAILRASSSEGGRRLMARGLRLRVGEEGLVGQVTRSGEAAVAGNIATESTYLDVPELPDTRSEIVLPLLSGGQMLGALDVQSTEVEDFDDEDVNALRVLADQVSMAINNAMLFEQLQSSLEAERKAYGLVSRQAWQDLLQTRREQGYIYRANKLTRASGEWTASMQAAVRDQRLIAENENARPTLSIPVTVSGETIGVMRLQKPEGALAWSTEEIELAQTLGERLSQALDSARLFQSAQQQAAQQQLTSQISSQMRETLDVDSVLRTAAQELGEAFKAREVVIRLDAQRRAG